MKSGNTSKRGEVGYTTALDGSTHSKADTIMECVGVVDELRAQTALVRQLIIEKKPEGWERLADFLLWLLNAYFFVGSTCSDPLKLKPRRHQGAISIEHVEKLEDELVRLEKQTKIPDSFLASASNVLAAHVDVARTLARRLERRVVHLKADLADFRADQLLAFLNKLSDYLFVLARYLEKSEHIVADYSLLKGEDRGGPS